jgi:hypothetical protein
MEFALGTILQFGMSEILDIQNFVNNKFQPAISSQTIDSFNPTTGQVNAKVLLTSRLFSLNN